MDISEKKKGEGLIISAALFAAAFPIITVLSYAALPSIVSLAWSSLFAAIFFGALVLYQGKARELQNWLVWKYVFAVVLFIGVLYYGLYFIGLQHTAPGNAASIALFEVCTNFVFFNILRREHISSDYILGATLMVLGALIVLARNFSGINPGDLFILAATFCAPAGNLFQQRARKIASTATILFLRSALTAGVLFLGLYLWGIHTPLSAVSASLPFLLLNGFGIFGLSKLFFLEGIHRMSVTKAIALGSFSPLITLLLAWGILGQTPTWWQLMSLIPLICGVLLLTDQFSLSRSKNTKLA